MADALEIIFRSECTSTHHKLAIDALRHLQSSDAVAWRNLFLRSFDTYLDDFSKEFHTYAVRWSPGEIVWYVDGVERQRVTEGAIAAQPMYVLFNLAIDGDWPKSPDASTVFPSALEIDYVRVYQK